MPENTNKVRHLGDSCIVVNVLLAIQQLIRVEAVDVFFLAQKRTQTTY